MPYPDGTSVQLGLVEWEAAPVAQTVVPAALAYYQPMFI